MKARVKATGKIVEVEDCGSVFRHGALFHGYKDANGIKYLPDEIELQMDFDYWEACQDERPDTPDYWTRLEHTYAGMAMQAYIIASHISQFSFCEGDMKDCKSMAHALVEKLKESK